MISLCKTELTYSRIKFNLLSFSSSSFARDVPE
uniref:Uncharacterized protein n=1 Tax=virus sp. ctx9V1 TaxID=2828001 RepID=A0A8S5RDR7_9VIRU|nr:MAG TPA: Protein of unknown function (DUF3781) [virus sp. ctx9V1]